MNGFLVNVNCGWYQSIKSEKRNRDLSVLESPVNLSGPKSCFAFVVLAFKIKVSIILKLI